MAKKACKCKETECEECPEWIFTFADLVMLMMGFFVILWVLKPSPGKDGEQPQALDLDVLAAIREAFGHVPAPDSTDPVDKYMLLKKLEQMKPLRGEGDGGKTKLERKGAEGDQPEVTAIRPGKQAIVGTRVLFAAGDAKLSAEALKNLSQIAELIKGLTNVMLVKGHCSLDDFGEGATEEQMMDLSLRRAKAAADHLVSKGVRAETLRVVGCSVHEPVAQRAYMPETRAMNRRVEIEAMRTLVPELQDRPAAAKPATDIHPPTEAKADAADATHG